MKIRCEKGCVLVISPLFATLFGLTTGKPEQTKGAAFFPFVFVRSEEFAVPWLINHERIHFRQQIDTLFIGAFFLGLLENFMRWCF